MSVQSTFGACYHRCYLWPMCECMNDRKNTPKHSDCHVTLIWLMELFMNWCMTFLWWTQQMTSNIVILYNRYLYISWTHVPFGCVYGCGYCDGTEMRAYTKSTFSIGCISLHFHVMFYNLCLFYLAIGTLSKELFEIYLLCEVSHLSQQSTHVYVWIVFHYVVEFLYIALLCMYTVHTYIIRLLVVCCRIIFSFFRLHPLLCHTLISLLFPIYMLLFSLFF